MLVNIIGEVPLIGKGADCNSVRQTPTTGSSPVLFKNKGRTNLVVKYFIVVEDSTVQFCGFTL